MRKEAAIQREFILWLKQPEVQQMLGGCIGVASNNNEHARHQLSMGVDVGSPDLLLRTRRLGVTYFLYIEMKTKSGKLKPSQVEWNSDFDANYRSSTCKRAVAHSLLDAKRAVTEWSTTLPFQAV